MSSSPERLAPRPAPVLLRAVPAVGIALVAATIAAGLTIHFATGRFLGTALAPFWMNWSPILRRPVIAGIAVATVLVGGAPWAIARVRPAGAFAALTYAGALALGLAVNAARMGTAAWDYVFVLHARGSYESSHEYLTALAYLRAGVAHYVADYPRLLPYLPTHAKGNPPGPVVAMHLLSIDTAGSLAAVSIAVGALCAPLAYALGRELGGEARGRLAAVLTMFSPAIVLFGVTSVDYAFAAMATAIAWLLVGRSVRGRAAGCLLAALASFFSWVLLAIPVWAVLVVVRRDGLRAAALTAAAALVSIVAFTGLLALVWGYDPVAVLRALQPLYAHGEAVKRPYAFWVFGSPAAYAAMLGLPILWGALRALARAEPAALALAAVVLVSAVAGFTKAETERIWLPFVPLAAVAAAALPVRRLRLALACLAAQGIALEVLFRTVW